VEHSVVSLISNSMGYIESTSVCARVARWLEQRRTDLVILASQVRIPLLGVGAVLRMRLYKQSPRVAFGWHEKEPSLLKAMSAKHRSKEAGPRRVKFGSIKWAKFNWSFDKLFSAWKIGYIWWIMEMVNFFEFFTIVPEIPSPKHYEIQEFDQNYHISAIKFSNFT
jgi:hypothetical protein